MFYVVLFLYVVVQFSVLLYSSVLLYCSLLFILLCSSSSYVCVFDRLYRTLTLPPCVNPIAVNTYLSGWGQVAGACECGNEPSGFITCGE